MANILLFIGAALIGSVIAEVTVMQASDPKVDWSGRRVVDGGTVNFDWLGVTARLTVTGGTYVIATINTTQLRGTRMRVWISDQGFDLYPQVQLWVTKILNRHILFTGSVGNKRLITLSNIVPPQYGTGITKVVSFETDGTFVSTPPQTRRIEVIGDSITAATNVVRPSGAPHCGDAGYQSDWSQTYSALLCQRFGASCSTIAVGGKCIMKECHGLQMPDYFVSTYYHDAPKPTYPFATSGWAPDAMIINLGTNDMRVIKTPDSAMGKQFTAETIAFMKNAVKLYQSNITFFLTTGPMENTTMPLTKAAVEQGTQEGLKVHWIDMRTACVDARLHAPDDEDGCDGCAGHPGIEGHYGMYLAAEPVIANVMGWNNTSL